MTRMHTSTDCSSARPGPQLRARHHWLLAGALLLLLALAPALTPAPALAQTATPAAGADAGVYVVQPGDSWTSVARKTGFGVRDLQAANPQAVRASGWLIVGEELALPGAATATPTAAPATSTPDQPAATATSAAEAGVYVVQPGDSWSSLARKTGFGVRDLQAANPQAVRASGWLIVGEELTLPGVTQPAPAPTATSEPAATPAATAEPESTAPAPTTAPPTATSEPTATVTPTAAPETEAGVYVVQPGESWNSIAQKFGVSADALRAANPQAVRPGLVLFRGDQLTIPGQGGATPPPPPTAVATATPAATATTAPEATSAPADTTPAAETGAEATAPAPEEAGPACPAEFAGYATDLSARLRAPEGMDGVLDFLRTCEALDETNLRSGDWNGDGADDYAVTIKNPLSDAAAPETDLFVFMSGESGHTLAYRARPAGQISILAADDINADGQPDLAWLDTTCGASTCFDTVMVRSWDGAQWSDWTSSTIVMAYADVTLEDARDTAQGSEIVLAGGEYGSVGAGPQRSRTEVWGSVDGAPYTLLDKVYARSTCLYFKVLDAGEALTRYQEIGLVQAREMYNEAITNRNLVPCGQRPGEMDELRSFSLFRLALVDAYAGEPDAAAESVAQLQQAYPDSIYTAMGLSWLEAYQASGDIGAACAAATAFAEQNPESYEALSDYGYANPTFTATDLCPVLAIQPAVTPEPAEAAETPAAGATEPITPLLTLTATTDVSAVAPALTGATGELPACPTTLSDYASVLPAVIAVSEADPLVVETWLRLCDGMADDRGGMLLADFNGDGREDALFLPTIVSDLGFGPGGAQGAILIYHGNDSGGYDLVYSPDVYGQPTLLAVEDLNGTGATDIAWTVEGCSTFCVKEVQMVTWDGDAGDYVSIIEPGATIAEGTATVEALPEGAPGKGTQLVLAGGVSGTAAGGLEVDHTETWQSVDGQPFRRLSWLYNRETAGNDCMGLRLVEADAALQAADLLGYAPAIERYRATLDPALRACSIFGVPATEELKLLQGLATFRLIQAQALAGDAAAADQDLAALQQGQPDSGFAQAADAWLAAYRDDGDAAAACVAVQPIFDKETLTWQITDHFGINHPALAPEQVCFVPRDVEVTR